MCSRALRGQGVLGAISSSWKLSLLTNQRGTGVDMGRNLKLVLSVLQGGECDPLHAQLYLSRGGGHDDGGGGRGSWPASQQDNLGTNLATQGEEKLHPLYRDQPLTGEDSV